MSKVSHKMLAGDLAAEQKFAEMGGSDLGDLIIACHGNLTRAARILNVQWRVVKDVYTGGLINAVVHDGCGLVLLTKRKRGQL